MHGPMKRWGARVAVVLSLVLAACNNSPYPDGAAATNTIFNSFDERSPRYLDPTASYSNPETPYTYSAYEPLYAYHYLKRPVRADPEDGRGGGQAALPRQGRAAACPTTRRPSRSPRACTTSSSRRASSSRRTRRSRRTTRASTSTTQLKPGEVGDKRSPWDFEKQGTRELVAEDYVYAFKRHATTRIEAPIFAIFSEYVIGLKEYAELIKAEDAKLLKGLPESSTDKPFLDFRQWPLAGVHGARQPHAAPPHQGQVPAVEVLAGDDLHLAGALGGRRLLRAAGHERATACRW